MDKLTVITPPTLIRHLIILLLLILAKPAVSQTFLDSYKSFCKNKINSSIQIRLRMTSDLRRVTNTLVKDWHTQLNKGLDIQIERLTMAFETYRKKTRYDFNDADSLTIIYQTTNNYSSSEFIIWSFKDTLKSTNRLALSKEINNGGGRLEPLKKDATEFKVYKTYNNNIAEPFLELALKTDTAAAFNTSVYCPIDPTSIIITAKKINGKYKIWDYYLSGFEFVVVHKK